MWHTLSIRSFEDEFIETKHGIVKVTWTTGSIISMHKTAYNKKDNIQEQ